jgi:hypothetical protein
MQKNNMQINMQKQIPIKMQNIIRNIICKKNMHNMKKQHTSHAKLCIIWPGERDSSKQQAEYENKKGKICKICHMHNIHSPLCRRTRMGATAERLLVAAAEQPAQICQVISKSSTIKRDHFIGVIAHNRV